MFLQNQYYESIKYANWTSLQSIAIKHSQEGVDFEKDKNLMNDISSILIGSFLKKKKDLKAAMAAMACS